MTENTVTPENIQKMKSDKKGDKIIRAAVRFHTAATSFLSSSQLVHHFTIIVN